MQSPESFVPWCDIRTAARHLNVSVSFLRKQIRLRRIPFARAGKNLRFRKSDLDNWMEVHSKGGEVNYGRE